MAARKRRVRELYLAGHPPRAIAEKLVKDGTIETVDESLESAIRLVRADVAEIRDEINGQRDGDAKISPTAADAIEREIERLRHSYAKLREIADDESFMTTTTDTPNGPIVSQRPKWPPGVRQKAAKDAATVAMDLSKLEQAHAASVSPTSATGPADGDPPPSFTFVFPNGAEALETLIAKNSGKTVN